MSQQRKRYVYQEPILEVGDKLYLRWDEYLKLHHSFDDTAIDRLRDWADQRRLDLVEIDGLQSQMATNRARVDCQHLYPPPGYESRTRLARRLTDENVRSMSARMHAQALAEAVDLGSGPTPEVDATTIPEGLAASWASNDPTHFVIDAVWCYQSMHRRVGPDEAPSVGAYSLLTWARENPDAFYRQILTKAIEMNLKLESARLEHERELAEIEARKELEQVKQQEMTDAEKQELAAVLDLAKELGVPWSSVEGGMAVKGKPLPEDLRDRLD